MICKWETTETGVVCVNCEHTKRRPSYRNCDASDGLGEKIAGFTKAIGIKPCGGCQGRREALNRLSVRMKKRKDK
mgnify:CR=1 FL=1